MYCESRRCCCEMMETESEAFLTSSVIIPADWPNSISHVEPRLSPHTSDLVTLTRPISRKILGHVRLSLLSHASGESKALLTPSRVGEKYSRRHHRPQLNLDYCRKVETIVLQIPHIPSASASASLHKFDHLSAYIARNRLSSRGAKSSVISSSFAASPFYCTIPRHPHHTQSFIMPERVIVVGAGRKISHCGKTAQPPLTKSHSLRPERRSHHLPCRWQCRASGQEQYADRPC